MSQNNRFGYESFYDKQNHLDTIDEDNNSSSSEKNPYSYYRNKNVRLDTFDSAFS